MLWMLLFFFLAKITYMKVLSLTKEGWTDRLDRSEDPNPCTVTTMKILLSVIECQWYVRSMPQFNWFKFNAVYTLCKLGTASSCLSL